MVEPFARHREEGHRHAADRTAIHLKRGSEHSLATVVPHKQEVWPLGVPHLEGGIQEDWVVEDARSRTFLEESCPLRTDRRPVGVKSAKLELSLCARHSKPSP